MLVPASEKRIVENLGHISAHELQCFHFSGNSIVLKLLSLGLIRPRSFAKNSVFIRYVAELT